MKYLKNYILTIGFLFIVFGMGIATYLIDDREISNVEQRTLGQMPKIDLKNILSGEFSEAYEKYITDQIAGRDAMIRFYTQEELLLNKSVINNLVVTTDNWILLPKSGKELYSEIDESIKKLNELQLSLVDEEIEYYFAFAPHKTNMLEHKYPTFLNTSNQQFDNYNYFLKKLPKEYEPINLYDHFSENFSLQELESMYYTTDHHWNLKGAFEGYQYIIDVLDEKSNIFHGESNEHEDFKLVCNKGARFIGSLNKQLYNLIYSDSEDICNYQPAFKLDTGTVKAIDRKGNSISEFNQIYGAGMNKEVIIYGDIFSWDLPEIVFKQNAAENNIHLLILKDSYGNPIQPFIANHFKKTSILDIRYYKEKSVYDYIRENDVNIVLFLYNDTNLTGEMYNLK